MKIKFEASGKGDFKTKEEYRDYAKQKFNIELDIDQIEFNPGLRFIAKISLNNLWDTLE